MTNCIDCQDRSAVIGERCAHCETERVITEELAPRDKRLLELWNSLKRARSGDRTERAA